MCLWDQCERKLSDWHAMKRQLAREKKDMKAQKTEAEEFQKRQIEIVECVQTADESCMVLC